MDQSLRSGRDWLLIAAGAFLGANLLHGADHMRQHLAGVDTEVLVGGALLTVSAAAVFVAAQRRSQRAPLLAALVGFATAVLVAASHVAPHWSALSDSYVDDIHPDVLSWAVMVLEIAAGCVLGIVGLRRLRERAPDATHGAPLTAGIEPT